VLPTGSVATEFATASATIGAFAAGALGIAEVDDVVVAAGSGQVEHADGIGSKLHLAAAFRLAFVAGALQDFLDAGRICIRKRTRAKRPVEAIPFSPVFTCQIMLYHPRSRKEGNARGGTSRG
jgi:hypothetical protein